jgi:hypothetical protein
VIGVRFVSPLELIEKLPMVTFVMLIPKMALVVLA